MRQPDPGAALAELISGSRGEPMSLWIKICGNTSLEDAQSPPRPVPMQWVLCLRPARAA